MKAWIFIILFILGVVGLVFGMVYACVIYPSEHSERATFEAGVLNVDTIDDISHLSITFDNNQTYEIYNPPPSYGGIQDFAMHSRWIVELTRRHNIFGIGDSKYWTIDSFVVVPE